MFTGLVEEIGSVLWIRASDRGTQLQIAAPRIAENIRTGDSIAVAMPCLSIASSDTAGVQGLAVNPLSRSSFSYRNANSPQDLLTALQETQGESPYFDQAAFQSVR